MIAILLIAYIFLCFFLTKRLKVYYTKKFSSKTITKVLTIMTFSFFIILIPYISILIARESFYSEKSTKTINENYYFTQLNYSIPLEGGGKRILIYHRNNYWFDNNPIDIDLECVYGDIDAKIIDLNNKNMKRLTLTFNDTIQLDTILDFNKNTKIIHKPY